LQRHCGLARVTGRDVMKMKRSVLSAAFVCALWLLVLPLSASSQSFGSFNVHLLIFECAEHNSRTFAPALALRATNQRFPADAAIRTLYPQSGVADVSGYVPPGTWVAYVTTGNGCADVFDLTVLPGASRSLTVATRIGLPLYNDHGSVAGTLPSSGLRVAVSVCESVSCSTTKNFTDYPAVVESKWYYANYLPPGKWILRIWFANALEPSVNLLLNQSTQVTASPLKMVRNVTMDDLKQLLQKAH